jgi:hypothetical protein
MPKHGIYDYINDCNVIFYATYDYVVKMDMFLPLVISMNVAIAIEVIKDIPTPNYLD